MNQYFQQLKSYVNQEKGIALVVVLMVLAVISIMGLSLMGLAANNNKMSTQDSNYQSSYYIAESGATYMANVLSTNVMNIYNSSSDGTTFFTNIESMMNANSGTTYNNFAQNLGQHPSSLITIQKINDSNANSTTTRDYNIISAGTIGNRTIKVVKPLQLTWVPKNSVTIPPDTSVFVNTFISLDGSANVSGAIGTNSSASSQIILNGGAYIVGNGNIYVGPNANTTNVVTKPDYIVVNNPIVKMAATKSFNLPAFPSIPSYPTPSNTVAYSGSSSYNVIYNGALQIDNWVSNNYTLTMNQNLSFSSINVNSNYTLNIDVGSSNRSIVVNNLNVLNGKIYILGTGTLTIYVTGNITMGSGSIVNAGGDPTKLNIYLTGSGNPSNPKSVSLSGSQLIYGSLFAQDANLSFGNGAGFQGSIVTGGSSIAISGGAYANAGLFYAPNADFTLTNGAALKGSIIAKSLTANGSSTITFQQLNLNNIPFISGNNTSGTVTINNLMASQAVKESN